MNIVHLCEWDLRIQQELAESFPFQLAFVSYLHEHIVTLRGSLEITRTMIRFFQAFMHGCELNRVITDEVVDRLGIDQDPELYPLLSQKIVSALYAERFKHLAKLFAVYLVSKAQSTKEEREGFARLFVCSCVMLHDATLSI